MEVAPAGQHDSGKLAVLAIKGIASVIAVQLLITVGEKPDRLRSGITTSTSLVALSSWMSVDRVQLR